MTGFLVAACAVLGLAVGSFLNVVIWRVPRKESVVHPSSHCPGCGTHVANRDNIPVLSYVLLKGRCRHCAERISARYPVVEVASAGLFAAAAARFGADWALPAYLLLFAMLLAVTVIDLDHFIIPNRIIYPTLWLTIPLLVGAAALGGGGIHQVERAAIGGLVGFGILFVINFVYPAGMGFGDVRLAGVIGIYLGWLSIGHVLLGLFLAFLLSSVISLGLIAARKATRKTPIPFGPFLALGTLVCVLAGNPILEWYRGP